MVDQLLGGLPERILVDRVVGQTQLVDRLQLADLRGDMVPVRRIERASSPAAESGTTMASGSAIGSFNASSMPQPQNPPLTLFRIDDRAASTLSNLARSSVKGFADACG